MAAAMSSLTRSLSSSSSFQKMPSQASLPLFQLQSYLCCFYSSKPSSSSSSSRVKTEKADTGELLNDIEDAVPTSGISRPLSEVLKQLNKKVPDSLVRLRHDGGFTVKYVPWHIVNRIMNLHAPEWSGEVRSITYSADGKSVSVVYRVTIYGTDAESLHFQENNQNSEVQQAGGRRDS
ncbi:DNA repair RAD52-like protein 1, mitochondrial isoform X3 [Tripterygium wilfordii]|uniref:DNA repair RAD52-like protein 1, mitochondrial isoform X3 n=1 Tax=Tripterygium wilfordii TaxID=458696 RepID=UPI0018F8637E|nr:DNA repair RAD52-like protein 1, mitochondrial isoform X3 [Tripterygium wilfordii]